MKIKFFHENKLGCIWCPQWTSNNLEYGDADKWKTFVCNMPIQFPNIAISAAGAIGYPFVGTEGPLCINIEAFTTTFRVRVYNRIKSTAYPVDLDTHTVTSIFIGY